MYHLAIQLMSIISTRFVVDQFIEYGVPMVGPSTFAGFQGTSNGGRQFFRIDGRIAISYHCMANLTVYLLNVSNSRRVDRHLRYPGELLDA